MHIPNGRVLPNTIKKKNSIDRRDKGLHYGAIRRIGDRRARDYGLEHRDAAV